MHSHPELVRSTKGLKFHDNRWDNFNDYGGNIFDHYSDGVKNVSDFYCYFKKRSTSLLLMHIREILS